MHFTIHNDDIFWDIPRCFPTTNGYLLLGKYYKDELTSEKDFFSFFAEDKFEFMQMMTSNKSAVCLETKLDFRKTAILPVQVMKIAVLYEML
jgi:hypothetical protein